MLGSKMLGGSGFGALVTGQDIHEASATQMHRLGTRLVRGDRIFKYAKAGATLATQVLGWYNDYGVSGWAACPTAAPAGATTIYATIGASEGVAADGAVAVHELQGAWIVVFRLNAGAHNTDYCFQILDNNAVAAGGGTVTLTIDSPLPHAMTTSAYTEITGNPYSDVRTGNSGGVRGFMGLPMAAATTSLPYFWLQTYGPCWISPQGRVGNALADFQCVARPDGSIDIIDGEAQYTTNGQRVGFVLTEIAGGGGGQGTPVIFLQISV